MPHLSDNIPLPDRAIITLCGPDRKKILQSLITNDVKKIAKNLAIYAALLTPQGKYLHDFFILEYEETLYLDCERARVSDLLRRLMMYKLRAAVDIVDCSDKYAVHATATLPPKEEIFTADPRHPDMGYRMIRPTITTPDTSPNIEQYDHLRLMLGLPDGVRDFDVDKTLILEGNMEELHGVDFDKGCYVGQEVTARMKYRASLKKRLLPVMVDGNLPERGTEITDRTGKKVGDIRSGRGTRAIGYFRLARITFDTPYRCGNAYVTPIRPDWLKKDVS